MTDAAKHPSDVRGTQHTRYKQLRDNHDVATLESKVRDKLAAFSNEINRQKAIILCQTEGTNTFYSSNNQFPNAMGAAHAHT